MMCIVDWSVVREREILAGVCCVGGTHLVRKDGLGECMSE